MFYVLLMSRDPAASSKGSIIRLQRSVKYEFNLKLEPGHIYLLHKARVKYNIF